jgi:hypothetical protein
MRLVALVLATSCAATAPAVTASHPASPQAPAGRLAGAAPSLRAGVIAYPDVPPLETEKPRGHQHDHH